MRVARWPAQDAPISAEAVATLGVFDGVHRGHVKLIGRVVEAARGRGCDAVVVTFDRHPSVLLDRRPAPAITSLGHRIRLFGALGVDACVVVEFTEVVARMPAEEFARRVFRDLVGARLLVLGFDARFGSDRRGDVDLCRRLGRDMGWQVESMAQVRVGGRAVSSTAIREAILSGELDEAERLLGRPFSLYGTVVHGDGRGRRLGYPTANLDLHHELLPPEGIYVTHLFTNGEPLPSVTSIGRQPTFRDAAHGEPVVEVHAIDRRLDLYGRDVEVQFVQRLRDQVAFADVDALRRQIGRDVARARNLLEAAR